MDDLGVDGNHARWLVDSNVAVAQTKKNDWLAYC
jgi:hypothetical protein